jgi:hypothetical protein
VTHEQGTSAPGQVRLHKDRLGRTRADRSRPGLGTAAPIGAPAPLGTPALAPWRTSGLILLLSRGHNLDE